MKIRINNALKGISVFHSVNLLFEVLQIKDIPMFEGISKRYIKIKNDVKLCSFGESRKKLDFTPFFGVFSVDFCLIYTNLIGIMCYSEFY